MASNFDKRGGARAARSTASCIQHLSSISSTVGITNPISQSLSFLRSLIATVDRQPRYLQQSLQAAKAGNYALGVKLVRGAYHPHELAAHPSSYPTSTNGVTSELENQSLPSISPDTVPPVWLNKNETDECYDTSAKSLVDGIANDLSRTRPGQVAPAPSLGVLFGTHNWQSCEIILDSLVQAGLAAVEVDGNDDAVKKVVIGSAVGERINLAQLYGKVFLLWRDDLRIADWFALPPPSL